MEVSPVPLKGSDLKVEEPEKPYTPWEKKSFEFSFTVSEESGREIRRVFQYYKKCHTAARKKMLHAVTHGKAVFVKAMLDGKEGELVCKTPRMVKEIMKYGFLPDYRISKL